METRHTDNEILREIITEYHYKLEHELNATIDRIKDLTSQLSDDTDDITRNEYTAALDKKDSYYIYRVFFTRTGVFMYTVNDLFTKKKDGKLDIIPLTYRVELNKESIDQVYDIKNQESLENV